MSRAGPRRDISRRGTTPDIDCPSSFASYHDSMLMNNHEKMKNAKTHENSKQIKQSCRGYYVGGRSSKRLFNGMVQITEGNDDLLT